MKSPTAQDTTSNIGEIFRIIVEEILANKEAASVVGILN